MVCAPETPRGKAVTPHSELAAFFIERNYKAIGCDRWDTRRVQLLCAKLGDTPAMLSARMRIRRSDLERRMEADCFTKQDGLILTMLEREIDFVKGASIPAGKLIS